MIAEAKTLKVPLLLAVAWLSISSSSVLVLLANVNALQAAFWRVTISSVILGLLGLSSGLKRLVINKLTILAGAMLAAHFLLWMQSLFLIPVSLSTTLVVWYPAISALIDRVVLHEKPSATQLLGLVIAILGVVAMLIPEATTEVALEYRLWEGVMLALLGSFSAAVYFSVGRWLRRSGVPLLEYATSVYSIASLTLLLFSIFIGESLIVEKPISWVFLILLALIPMIGGHTVINYLLKSIKTFVATSIAIGEPVGATLLAMIILQQAQPPQVIALMPVVIAGLAFVIYRS